MVAGKGRLVINIYAKPGAKKTQIMGLHDGALKVAIHAPPVDGKANEELISWLAKLLGIPKRAIEITHGLTGRRKTLTIFNQNPEGLIEIIKKTV
ncbi:MAG: YggU family protein [Oligoflexia bacterium]|nr:YggU family protein [Oligoflexia bacterium]